MWFFSVSSFLKRLCEVALQIVAVSFFGKKDIAESWTFAFTNGTPKKVIFNRKCLILQLEIPKQVRDDSFKDFRFAEVNFQREMYRSHSCGELRASHINTEVTLSGWVQKSRDKGFMIWVDLRDRYGITQLIFDEDRTPKEIIEKAKTLGREFVIQVTGTVIERSSKNPKMETGDVEILVSKLEILNEAKVPPFTIEDETDGGEDIRMKYRYLDIRRNPVKNTSKKQLDVSS